MRAKLNILAELVPRLQIDCQLSGDAKQRDLVAPHYSASA